MHFVITGQTGVGTSELAHRMNSLSDVGKAAEYTAVVFDDVTGEETLLPPCDGVIVAVNLLDGPMPGTREGIRRAAMGDVPVVGIALTHLDQFLAQTQIRHSIRELVGWETRGLLSQYGYTDAAVPLAELGLVAGCEDSVSAFRDAVLAYMQK